MVGVRTRTLTRVTKDSMFFRKVHVWSSAVSQHQKRIPLHERWLSLRTPSVTATKGVRHYGALSCHAEAQDSATRFSDAKSLALRACALVQRSVDGGSAGMVAAPYGTFWLPRIAKIQALADSCASLLHCPRGGVGCQKQRETHTSLTLRTKKLLTPRTAKLYDVRGHCRMPAGPGCTTHGLVDLAEVGVEVLERARQRSSLLLQGHELRRLMGGGTFEGSDKETGAENTGWREGRKTRGGGGLWLGLMAGEGCVGLAWEASNAGVVSSGHSGKGCIVRNRCIHCATACW